MRLWWLLASVTCVCARMPAMDKLAATEKLKMSPSEYKQVVRMHQNWYAQAVHGLLIAHAKKAYKEHAGNAHVRKAIVACLDDVSEENAVKQTADCLTHLFDGTLIHEMGDKVHVERYAFVAQANEIIDKAESSASLVRALAVPNSTLTSAISTPSSLTTTTSTTTLPSFVQAKIATSKRRRRRHRKGKKNSRQPKRRRAKRAISAFLGAKSDTSKKRTIRIMDRLDYILDPSGSGIKSTTAMLENILKIAKGKGSQKVPFDFMMHKIEQLRDAHIEAKTEGGYRRRMLDSVLGPDHPIKLPDMSHLTITKELRNILPNEYKSLVDMIQKVPGIDDKGRDRFLSPRFMPLFPNGESRDNNSILSPEIMPMYRLPSLLETTGLMERERNALLSLILESSGAMDMVDTAMDSMMKTKDLGMGEDFSRVNKLIGNTFTEIKSILSPQQHAEMGDRQFTLATSDQLKKLYGSQGKYNESEFPIDLHEYDKWSEEEKEQSLRNTIRILADRPTTHGGRYKRALGVPDIVFPNGYTIKFFAHTTLSPFFFSPSINTLSVLGPVLLSPSLFCPSFMSGLLFSPPVISPQLADPLFLSPYVLGPDVLSAAMFNVYVLSPYFMSPNVINPYIASPLILSPYVMCPDVLSPTILSGAILSPSVLSPQVYTKNAMSVSLLSPSFLS